jgi:DNA-binding response OmpR family regulator
MSTLHHILVVEDDTDIANLVRLHLEKAGFQVSRAADGQAAIKRFDEGEYDLVILDLMLPGGVDGMQVCRHIRESSGRYVPVIMLTAKGEEANKVAGLEMGADDYMTKPFSVEELVARVRAIGRRVEKVGGAASQESEPTLQFGDLSIDLSKRLALKEGQDLHLTQKEFEILRILALAPGRPFSRRHLCERAGVESFDGTDRTIDTHIKRLRAKLETDRNRPQYVLTVWGFGYKFSDKFC